MFAKWLNSVLTPCPRHLRRMGYLDQMLGLESRYRRCRASWTPHLEACKRLILETAGTCVKRDKAAILGSGFLYDVPLAELASLFAEVVLVDILHPPAVRRWVRRLPNVRLEACDTTGVVKDTHALVKRGHGEPLPLPTTGGLPEADADFVVSANVLTQLPILPWEYVESEGKRRAGHEIASYPELVEFARLLMENHLQALARLSGAVCLITEVEHLICDGDRVVERVHPLHGIPFPFSGVEWIWDIKPHPEADPRYDHRYRILGVTDLGVWPSG